MTDIPEDICEEARRLADDWFRWAGVRRAFEQALAAERSRQIERDAKIVEGPPMNEHAPGYLLIQKLAAQIRAQEPK